MKDKGLGVNDLTCEILGIGYEGLGIVVKDSGLEMKD